MNALAKIPTLEELSRMPRVECPVSHYQPPGVYCREIFMPAGTFIIGHLHKTEHINIVIKGRARVLMSGKVYDIQGPMNFISKKGVRKVLFILEDMIWMTVHPTREKSIEKIAMKIIDLAASGEITEGERKLLLEGPQ